MPMIVHAAYEDNGKIIAVVATQSTRNQEGQGPTTSQEGPRPRFQERPGISVGDFEVPANFVDKKMSEILAGLHVDAATGRLIEG
jgi:hypothetical protein